MRMLERKPDSRKGENGRVLVVGGSEVYHGAPLFSALGAEYSGVDLIYPVIPKCHAEVAKSTSLNFIVHSFSKNYLTKKDVPLILDLSGKTDVLVMGPGLGEDEETIKAMKKILENIEIPLVLDASALLVADVLTKRERVLTPHRGEFEKMAGVTPATDEKEIENQALGVAGKFDAVVVLKGSRDVIASPSGDLKINTKGNAGLTAGGTGDLLSGLIGGLIAQGVEPFQASFLATKVIGTIGEALFEERGWAYRAVDVVRKIPGFLKK
ncbi:MAG TPA: NAD(P)H-hydrate dehydratase [Candidatus Peregrinibacteria bacterium]|nr:NAD(P)H-hydrate dehydratase [Candidatus Peregrinibacteria bacterium]